ncbi:GntR family transcriptional regulator [Allokutzneria albata]|uniref:DNA-binding transcriptional regulator, GntR family n=1 Tax=Allokutzneria albata TaxID=211114 RepID=A0A1G9VCN5_ALLAB|nr:GntR family transcriptional regulator [Allokutzneria albata]SDM69826.1 DNA-binding transcriptional regulator, GntR family [Allokutzneria albata]
MSEGEVAGCWSLAGDEELSTGERVYLALRQRIVSGQLTDGCRLVETRLAARFNVSRTPVREAVKRLTADGLIAPDALKGLVVVAVGPEEADEIFQVRAALDGLAASLAAERITGDSLARLHRANDRVRDGLAAGDLAGMVEANLDFHAEIYAVAGNRTLSRIADKLNAFVVRTSSRAFGSTEFVHEVLAEHEEIAAALARRDGEEAARLSREHMNTARRNARSDG